MKHVVFEKLSSEEVKRIRQQVVRLKEMGKTGKEIEGLTGVCPGRVSEIWKAYQCIGEAALEVKKGASIEFFHRKKQKYGRQSQIDNRRNLTCLDICGQ